MSNKKLSLSKDLITVITAIIGVVGTITVAYFAFRGVVAPKELEISATQTAEARLTEARLTEMASIPSAMPSPGVSFQSLGLTATEIQNQLEQAAHASATAQYLTILDSVKKTQEAQEILNQVQQELIITQTQQALNAEVIAQAMISNQQTATVLVNNQSGERVLNFADQLSNLPISFFDTFEANKNGWSPKSDSGYNVSMKGDILTVNYSDPKFTPFIWTCDNCGTFNNFSYQIDIKTPKDAPDVIAGILFGSPARLDQQPFQESYALSVYSTGAVLLQRLSLAEIDTVHLWDHRQDLITPDGEYHTLQLVTIDNYAAVYVDGKLVGDVLNLDFSTAGYIGIVTQSPNVDVVFDNLKVVLMP